MSAGTLPQTPLGTLQCPPQSTPLTDFKMAAPQQEKKREGPRVRRGVKEEGRRGGKRRRIAP